MCSFLTSFGNLRATARNLELRPSFVWFLGGFLAYTQSQRQTRGDEKRGDSITKRVCQQPVASVDSRRHPRLATQPVVKVRRRTEAGDAPGWQGATTENIGNI